MNRFLIVLNNIIYKFTESIKKPIVILYNIYCLIIFILYNFKILGIISSSNDKINILLYVFFFISSFISLENNSDSLGLMLFFDNNFFCLINIVWLLYMTIRIFFNGYSNITISPNLNENLYFWINLKITFRDNLYTYLKLFVFNALFLLIMIIINILYNTFYKIYKNIFYISKDNLLNKKAIKYS